MYDIFCPGYKYEYSLKRFTYPVNTTSAQRMDLSIAIAHFECSDWFVSSWVSCALAFSSRQTSCSRAAMYLPMDGSTPRRFFRADFCSSLSTFIGFAQPRPTFLPTLASLRGILIRRQANTGTWNPRRDLWRAGGLVPQKVAMIRNGAGLQATTPAKRDGGTNSAPESKSWRWLQWWDPLPSKSAPSALDGGSMDGHQ